MGSRANEISAISKRMTIDICYDEYNMVPASITRLKPELIFEYSISVIFGTPRLLRPLKSTPMVCEFATKLAKTVKKMSNVRSYI